MRAMLPELGRKSKGMVPRSRFERLAFPLGGGCSIHLSYRGKWVVCRAKTQANITCDGRISMRA